jgi:hypothetical protein
MVLTEIEGMIREFQKTTWKLPDQSYKLRLSVTIKLSQQLNKPRHSVIYWLGLMINISKFQQLQE